MAEIEAYLDVGQVAELLGLSVATIRKWVLLRHIPFRKLGRAVRFSVKEIREWADSHIVNPVTSQKTLADTSCKGGEK